MTSPSSTLRLFPTLRVADLETPEASTLVVGRLLEEGDRDDLQWLCQHYGEVDLAGWLAQRGARQLSRRSRAFWSLLLGGSELLSDSNVAPTEEALWPL